MVTDHTLDILLVEDTMNSSLLSEKIKQEFDEDVRVHKNNKDLLKEFNLYKNLDLIIIDQPYSSEVLVDTLKIVRKKSPYTEVIVLSEKNETGLGNSIKRAGAYDYIYKDRSTSEKISYVIKGFRANKRLNNKSLALTEGKSIETVVAMTLIVLAILAGGFYFLVL